MLAGTPAPDHAAVIVMAKPPVPGRVKTRLASTLGDEAAADVHRVMLTCVLDRLKSHCPGRHILALDGYSEAANSSAAGSSESAEAAAIRATAEEAREIGWKVIGQAAGDLGDRLTAAWEASGSGPVAFFGVDSPDVPEEALNRLWELLEGVEVAVGPAEDGGFWTLLAQNAPKTLWNGIDWGTEGVFSQLWGNLERLDLARNQYPIWHDVDDLAGLEGLMKRLAAEPESALVRLKEQLERLMQTPNGSSAALDHELATGHGSTGAGLGQGLSTGTLERDEPDYSNCRVMIVDDNQQNVELLEAYLEPLGCRVDAALDGIEAVALLEQRASGDLPDLVLLDVMMPRMSGFEVCRKIKDDPRTRAIPVMMVTALHEVGDVEKAVECGTDDFLSKPVNKVELLTRAKSLLKVRHLKRELEQAEARLGGPGRG
ncbi:DUF2064 domain-containing protein [Mucisphaera sp.]|uniref:DUF2064 domain-containing protein n=1 Tax=Mucisphaera sp. TaxID=2913024 RepID=UPI003D107CDE